ncbi:hypothetical protein TSUD_310950 [Trifolium subterraneum]|uniref:Uncharacterized protein n=1 Tax=Trifolium subterraneum TaxID=3900 RepID=A0A2Z6NUH9_TRISU|nr:hypothetical protein TSUD_310950 [Trifolium subterraneum]
MEKYTISNAGLLCQEDLKRTREHLRASDTAVVETSVKALDICSEPVDEDIVKEEENTVNDLTRE